MEWRSVAGFEGAYSVSPKGDVWSHHTEKILKPYAEEECPYVRVDLRLNGKRRQPYVHTLVAFAFLEDPEDDEAQVHHIDGDPTNNRAENLEWLTPKEHADLHNGKHEEKEFAPEEEAPF